MHLIEAPLNLQRCLFSSYYFKFSYPRNDGDQDSELIRVYFPAFTLSKGSLAVLRESTDALIIVLPKSLNAGSFLILFLPTKRLFCFYFLPPTMVWGAGVAASPRWRTGLLPSLMIALDFLIHPKVSHIHRESCADAP